MLNKRFLQKISDFIASNNLLDKGCRHIVALSGGADSVALLLALKELGYTIEAAHCNFHLRGDESDRDEKFCISLCNENGIKLHVTHFDTTGFARLRKVSIEMAARHLRYAYFKSLMADIGAATVCVAHHRDDSVETVLMNLIRGTGIHGLTGIKPRNDHIVRPMLTLTRAEIENALAEASQSYVTDSTNLEADVVRNKIRLNILPLMREINPSVSDSIAMTAERLAETAEIADESVKKAIDNVVETSTDGTLHILSDRLKAEPSPEIVLFNILKDRSFNSSQISKVLQSIDAEPGRVFCSPTHRLLIDRARIIVERVADDTMKPLVMPEEGLYVYGEMVKFDVRTIERDDNFKVIKDGDHCFADMSKVKLPLTVRRVAAGDRFTPFGMKGSKLVSDFLTDIKLNLFDKRRQLVMTDATGKIIWIVGRRTSDLCRITPQTVSVLCVSVKYKD